MIKKYIHLSAENYFNSILITRRWNAEYGGVYVYKKSGVESNPYLANPDIVTREGMVLTMKNPALMTREISEMADKGKNGGYRYHITSLKPRNPHNAPDEWERSALEGFESGALEAEKTVTIEGRNFYRFMKPLLVEEKCLACHGDQGYKVGDIRGGISVLLPYGDIDIALDKNRTVMISLAIAIAITFAVLFYAIIWKLINRLASLTEKLQDEKRKVDEMNQALDRKVEEKTAELTRVNQMLRENESKLKDSLKEQETLLREVHHRVKNNMAVISSMLSLQSGYVDDEKYLEMFKESQGRIRSMALVHEQLYKSRDLSRIDVGHYITTLAKNVKTTFGGNRKSELRMDIVSINISIDGLIPLGLIINEMLTNSYKHGFDNRDSLTIDISLKRHSDAKLILTIRDDGAGLPDSFDINTSEKGLGLKMISSLTQQIDGELTVQNKPAQFTIIFPEKIEYARHLP